MERQLVSLSNNGRPQSLRDDASSSVGEGRYFDVIGNLPEDILGEVISYLPDASDLCRLISWQTVSKRWRMLLHDPATRIYHQTLLKSKVFESLLPPTYYNAGKSDTQSSFSYATFRRAIRTHVAMKNGILHPIPKRYEFGCRSGKPELRSGEVEAGPILADGFLVWLATTRYSPAQTITLKIVDLTRPATAGRNLDLEWRDGIDVAEFTTGSDRKIHREGFDVDWIGLYSLSNMAWRALGCGGGLAAYWIAGDHHITVRDLTKSTVNYSFKIHVSALKDANNKMQDRHINHLLCNKDYIVLNLSRSSNFGVYSVATKTLLHVVDSSPEIPDGSYGLAGMLGGWRERTSFAVKIQDNFLVIACVMGMFFLLEETTLRFKSWDLDSAPIYEEYSPPIRVKKEERQFGGGDWNSSSSSIERPKKYQFTDLQVLEKCAGSAAASSPCYCIQYPVLRPSAFLDSLASVILPLSLPHEMGLYGPKLFFQPHNALQLYCQDKRNPKHPTHPHLRWSYPMPPTCLDSDEISICTEFTSRRRGYSRAYKDDERVFNQFKRWFAMDVRIADVRYELTLPPIPLWLGGASTAWVDQKAWRAARKSVRLQMTPVGKGACGDDEKGAEVKHWDAEIDMKRFRRDPHRGHGVSIAAGWEGIAVLWLDQILVWRWDLDEDKTTGLKAEKGQDRKSGLVGRVLKKVNTF